MTDVTQLSPELARRVAGLARALVAAARGRALYPPEHPAVTTSLGRLQAAILEATSGVGLALGVTPSTLLVEGAPAATGDGPVADAAAYLHARDILEIAFAPDVPPPALDGLLTLLATDPDQVRAGGGPAAVWSRADHPAITIVQVDYQKVLEDRDVRKTPATKDDLWRSIVRAINERHKTLDEAAEQRLFEIAGDVAAIGELAADVMAPARTPDGSPMVTMQAAAVLAAYRHLSGIVSVLAPERRDEVMGNIAAATARLEPGVVLQMLAPGAGGDEGDVVGGIVHRFDDVKVAQLLATTLAIDGQASQRLAAVFDTIAPDAERKQRVLRMAKSLLGKTVFGQRSQFATLWSSMEELLLTYNERPFVSTSYRTALDEATGRAAHMAVVDLPPESTDWIATLGQENVRRLSVTLLIDLLNLEEDAARAPQLAEDVAALAEDLLMEGDYDLALQVVQALAARVADRQAVTSGPSRVALDGLADSLATREAVDLLDQMDDAQADTFFQLAMAAGPAVTSALLPTLALEPATRGRERASAIACGFGAAAVSRLAPLISDSRWFAQRNAAALMGDIGSPEAVRLLQPLLRGRDPRVTRAAVRALSNIDDPSAARAVHTVLRTASGELRRAVIEALVAERDPRVVPVLLRILNESEPLGADHAIVLETLGALGTLGDDQAVDDISRLMRRRSWLARRKIRAIKQTSLQTLRRIGTSAAALAIEDAMATGDRLLRRLARTVAS